METEKWEKLINGLIKVLQYKGHVLHSLQNIMLFLTFGTKQEEKHGWHIRREGCVVNGKNEKLQRTSNSRGPRLLKDSV